MSVLKSLFAVSLTGASSVGGTLIYQTAVPGSWKDVLLKEGYYIIVKDEHYQAVYEDSKDGVIKEIDSFKDDTSLTRDKAHEKIKPWCETELSKSYDRDLATKKRLINLCTSDGIITIKARLIADKQGSLIADEANDQRDKQYKIVFAIYRYHDRFTNFFKKWRNDKDVNQETSVEQGYIKLKTACEEGMKKEYREEDSRYVKNISWWCTKFGYETFEKLAKHRKSTWETDEQGKNKGETWKYNSEVTKHILNTSGGKDQAQQTLDDNKVKEWCNKYKNKSIEEENDGYKEKFIVFLSVCEKVEIPSFD